MYKQKKWDVRHLVVVFLIVLLLFLVIVTVLNKQDRNLSYPEKVIKDTTLLVVKTLKKPFDFVRGKVSDKELESLKEKAKQVDLMQAKYDEALKDIKDLKELVELNSTLRENSHLNATVISRNVGYWNQSLTIDKGKKNGVEVGMAVINSQGLVGKIESVSNFNSTVKLLTSEDVSNKISVKIKVSDDDYVYGLLNGYDSKTKRFQIEGIAENKEIPKDSLVTTTGLSNAFPSGVFIGKVDSISKDHFDLASKVSFVSEVDFEKISYVTVLKKDATS